MQYSRDKYFPQLITKVVNLVGEPHNTSLAVPIHKITNPCTQREQGVVNPSTVTCKIKLYGDRFIDRTKIQNKENKEKLQQGIFVLIYDKR